MHLVNVFYGNHGRCMGYSVEIKRVSCLIVGFRFFQREGKGREDFIVYLVIVYEGIVISDCVFSFRD